MITDISIVCPDDIMRAGIERILEQEGFRNAGSFRDVHEISQECLREDCLYLVDSPSTGNIIQDVEYITCSNRNFKAIVLADKFDLLSMIACFKAGAHGYLVKSGDAALVTASLRLAAAGRKVPPAEIIDLLEHDAFLSPSVADNHRHIKESNLSPRELDVLCCLMAGYSNKFIARQLDVCEATVKVHVKGILRKLNVHNRTQAAIWANAHGMSDYAANAQM